MMMLFVIFIICWLLSMLVLLFVSFDDLPTKERNVVRSRVPFYKRIWNYILSIGDKMFGNRNKE